MLYNGCFNAAKRVALALDSLIRGKYPRDQLSIIGFSYLAQEIKPGELPTIDLERVQLRHEHAAWVSARAPDPGAAKGRQPADHRDHRRRADGPLRQRTRPLQLSTDTAHIPGDVARGRPLHPRRHHHQHVHARALAVMVQFINDLMRINTGRVFCGHARIDWANTSWSITSPTSASSWREKRVRRSDAGDLKPLAELVHESHGLLTLPFCRRCRLTRSTPAAGSCTFSPTMGAARSRIRSANDLRITIIMRIWVMRGNAARIAGGVR